MDQPDSVVNGDALGYIGEFLDGFDFLEDVAVTDQYVLQPMLSDTPDTDYRVYLAMTREGEKYVSNYLFLLGTQGDSVWQPGQFFHAIRFYPSESIDLLLKQEAIESGDAERITAKISDPVQVFYILRSNNFTNTFLESGEGPTVTLGEYWTPRR